MKEDTNPVQSLHPSTVKIYILYFVSVAVRPSVRASTNLVQAQDTEMPNFLGVVKEVMTSLSAQSDNKGTSNLTFSGRIVTLRELIGHVKKIAYIWKVGSMNGMSK
ncbi:uncharacterized protein LOC134182329 isoform X1 [Corticium candelabrum]|uniref:uncharacterized protein LOC134182329 isoform X1 n=1 Tax=Corticium candelabrum TaxID=121492 RepID=UPI002E2659DF|nr:uncharacterized protein LOC134182329 isoform X1 [Corticium candelabrum]